MKCEKLGCEHQATKRVGVDNRFNFFVCDEHTLLIQTNADEVGSEVEIEELSQPS